MTISRSTNPVHIKVNFDTFAFKLTEDEMKEIRALDKHKTTRGWPKTMEVDA